MSVKCPQRYSVWENDKGVKIFIEEADYVEDEDEDEGEEPFFTVSVVAYGDRDDMNAMGDQMDPEEWADFIETNGFRQTGIEPPSSD
ncbi:hypothetical protein G3N59_29515 [Paraburkholderia sp. Ac-20340]|uniref:hypothetical protein n=1 Tax=Paraburkholderia sp. Ac-20340 TaxID=2703888 RepID=UPI001981C388|nr:hypothetical protein [Paraburkholderia sp. Ac-20340]MBN3857532.1 hypothetical protein [Paraburkholderia sp. Ac-20340]